MQLYVFNLTVKLFLSLNGKTSQQKEKNNVPLALIAIYTQTHSKTVKWEATIYKNNTRISSA